MVLNYSTADACLTLVLMCTVAIKVRHRVTQLKQTAGLPDPGPAAPSPSYTQ